MQIKGMSETRLNYFRPFPVREQVEKGEAVEALDCLRECLGATTSREVPREACGLIVKRRSWSIVPLENVSGDPTRTFELDTRQFLEQFFHWGECVRAFYHSHPVGPSALSGADVRFMRTTGLDMVLVDLRLSRAVWATLRGNRPHGLANTLIINQGAL